MIWHDFLIVIRYSIIFGLFAVSFFIALSVCTWCLIVTGSGGRFKEDVYAFMQRHGKPYNSLFFLMAGLAVDPGLQAIFLYRLGSFFAAKRLMFLGVICQTIARIFTGASISPLADIGGGLEIFHACGLTVGNNVKIGSNAWLFQNVTIGTNGSGSPKIGSGVKIFAGAVVAGPIHIGTDVIIGANAVVLKDVPDYMMVESPTSIHHLQDIKNASS